MKTRIISLTLAVLVLGLLGTGVAEARGTCKVTAGKAPYPTILSAVNDTSCSRIEVPAGTFYENMSISRDVTISGVDDNTIVDGGGKDTVFTILGATVTLRDMKITHGSGGGGGGIRSEGTLTVENSTITNNTNPFGSGGGIVVGPGMLIVKNSIISNNTVDASGAGIFSFGRVSPTLVVQDSTITGNTASFGCGGGISSEGPLTVKNSTISKNTAAQCAGGIISEGPLTVKNSTVSKNTTGYGNGGGIISYSTLTVQNSTITGNTAYGSGGGIENVGTAIVQNSTITGNTAGFHGGGIFNCTPSNTFCTGVATLTVKHSIIANNTPDNIYP